MRRMNVVNRKQALKVVKELDAFPKVPDSYKETTVSGGGISILVFIAILILVISEFIYYTETELKFDYQVDTEFDGKLRINIDITVAMRCSFIGADVLDVTGQNAESFGHLKEEPAYFNLSPKQWHYLEMMQHLNDYIRNEYHAVHKFLWKSGYSGMQSSMPAREDQPTEEPDGCRLHGYFLVNKVAGNFHITVGKSVPVIPRGHAHLALMVSDRDYNFSHRIDQFSFGEVTPGVVNPLDGDFKVTTSNYHMFQYFMQVVPTRVKMSQTDVDTFQYSVTEKNRTINHAQGSHGVPGIFVKYDLSSLKIFVREEHKPYWQFLVRLCGIIGGIFATSGLLHNLSGAFVDFLCCRYKLGKYKPAMEAGDQTAPVHSLNDAVNNTDIVPSVNLLTHDIPQ